MKKVGLKTMTLAFVVGLLAIMPLLMAQTASAEPKAIRIGHLGEWTGPAGRTAGPPGDALISYFHEYVNKEKGGIEYRDPKTGKVLGKVKVEVLYADCRYELPLFKSAYRNFVDKGIVACHSTCSPALEGLKKDFKRDKIPCFQTSSNTVAHWPPGWIYGHRPSFADDMGVHVDWILKNWKEKRPPRIGLMYYDGPLGKSMLWGGPQYAKSKGCEIVADEPIPGMIMDSTSQLLRIKQAKADFIITCLLGSQLALVCKDMERMKYNIPVYEITGTDANELSALGGKAVNGVYITFPGYTNWDESRPAIKWVNEHYRKYMKGRAGYDVEKQTVPDGVWYVGWLIANIMEESMRLALEKVPPEKLTGLTLRDYGINRMKDYTCNGLQKGVTYYPGVDHRGSDYTIIHRVVDQKDSTVTGWIKAPCLLPPWMKKK